MLSVINAVSRRIPQVRQKISQGIARVFKEQSGGAEVIATLIIIAVVLVLALTFRDKLSQLVASLWNDMQTMGKDSGSVSLPKW